MTESAVFILKDNRGNYVGVDSISYDKPSRNNIYSYSEQLANGYYTYSDESDAIKELKLLQDKGIKINFVITFHIEKINMLEVLRNESRTCNIESCPFKHIVIDERTINSPMFDFIGMKSFIMNYRAMCEVGL